MVCAECTDGTASNRARPTVCIIQATNLEMFSSVFLRLSIMWFTLFLSSRDWQHLMRFCNASIIIISWNEICQSHQWQWLRGYFCGGYSQNFHRILKISILIYWLLGAANKLQSSLLFSQIILLTHTQFIPQIIQNFRTLCRLVPVCYSLISLITFMVSSTLVL